MATEKTRPAFSVCMATYNGRVFVGEQLASILAELRDGDELIVVDDCSSDGTPEVIADVLNSSQKGDYTFVRLDRNHGHRHAFLEAMTLATNPLVALSDQDDLWHQGRLETMADLLDSHSVALTFGSLQTFGSSKSLHLRNPSLTLQGRRGLWRFLMHKVQILPTLYAFGSACAFRRPRVDLSQPMTTETHEQWLICIGLLSGGVHFSPELVTYRRLHFNNQTHRRPLMQRMVALRREGREMGRTVRRVRKSAN